MNAIGDSSIKWGWWLAFGLVLIALGVLFLTTPVVTTLASVFYFGVLLLVAGLVHFVTAMLDKHSNHFWLHLITAAFTAVIGLLMILNPKLTLLALTLLIASFFLTSGLFRIIGAIVSRFPGWGWFLLSGVVSLLLGVLILAHWPTSSLWVIGLFIGIDFIFAGWSLVMVSLFLKKKPSLPIRTVS